MPLLQHRGKMNMLDEMGTGIERSADRRGYSKNERGKEKKLHLKW